MNIEEKASEIRKILNDPNLIKWFSKYIVFQRAPVEINFHSMYISLIEKLSKPEIFKQMVTETFGLLHKILDILQNAMSEKSLSQIDKNILKHLGSWLGQLTLARNKAIIMKDLDLKGLIIDAYEQQKLDYILPLTCKILTHGNHPDSVFKPKNAWMNGILSLLTEISGMPKTKMTLKCEIQVLLNNLGIGESEIVPTKTLQIREQQRKKQKALEAKEKMNRAEEGLNENTIAIHELPHYVNLDTKILEALPNIKSIVAQGLELAIREILPPVITKSLQIALITTRELVLKDFSIEPDEKKLLRGAHLIIQNLTGNLALVTCRDPLKLTFQQCLVKMLEKLGLEDKAKEEIIDSAVLENLDLGCALIKKAVIEEAVESVSRDPLILEACERRKLFAAKGILFYDEMMVQSYNNLPPALRPSIGGLTRDEMAIYEVFGKSNRGQGSSAPRFRALEGKVR